LARHRHQMPGGPLRYFRMSAVTVSAFVSGLAPDRSETLRVVEALGAEQVAPFLDERLVDGFSTVTTADDFDCL